MNKKILMICIMIIIAVGGILIDLPFVSLGIHIGLLMGLLYLLINISKGRQDLRVYIFPYVLCQIATVGPYYSAVTVRGLGFYGLLSIALGGIVAMIFANNKKILPTASKLLLVGIFIVSMTWFTGQTMLINATFQSSDTEIYIGEITDKEIGYGRMLNDYYVLYDYHDAQEGKVVHESTQVSKKTYRQYKIGDGIRVEIHHGLLGIEYYDLSRVIQKFTLD